MAFTELLISPWLIAGLFFIIAFIYSSVGLGGGSSYTALMAILGFSTLAIPLVSLSLNLLVTTIGSFNFIRKKHASWPMILPFLLTSMPMAYLGGALNLPKIVFYWLLLVSLLFVAARIYLWRDTSMHLNLSARGKFLVSLLAGSLLGLLAGIVGIGGGIYLVPLIIILGLGSHQQAAACGAIFVWLNSAAGLTSRLQYNAIDLSEYVPLIIAVLLGGGLGSYMGSTRFSSEKMEKVLGLIILVAIGFLGRKLLFP
ncbi:TSUP family transporter [Sulfuriflexus mobilis]|uniref:TSUP family transporter n=1 Tax=Sulfuriflexus mobilis TaxID=1811807 RepID=UPI000F83DBF0|nr:TSUP family transporter [Sulfuriflexus mobilis]